MRMEGDQDGYASEDEIDAFADKLAEDMISHHHASSGFGADIDDDDEGSFDGAFGDVENASDGSFGASDDDGDNVGECLDGEDDDDDAEVLDFDEYLETKSSKQQRKGAQSVKATKKKYSSRDDDLDALIEDSGSEDGEFSFDAEQVVKSGKKRRGSCDPGSSVRKAKKAGKGGRGNDMDDFADADDYREELEAIVKMHFGNQPEMSGLDKGNAGSKKQNLHRPISSSRKGARNSRKK